MAIERLAEVSFQLLFLNGLGSCVAIEAMMSAVFHAPSNTHIGSSTGKRLSAFVVPYELQNDLSTVFHAPSHTHISVCHRQAAVCVHHPPSKYEPKQYVDSFSCTFWHAHRCLPSISCCLRSSFPCKAIISAHQIRMGKATASTAPSTSTQVCVGVGGWVVVRVCGCVCVCVGLSVSLCLCSCVWVWVWVGVWVGVRVCVCSQMLIKCMKGLLSTHKQQYVRLQRRGDFRQEGQIFRTSLHWKRIASR
jgi:hypothetical protein